MACKAPGNVLELWFDFSCPYAYFASKQAASLGVEVDWRPMLLGGVFRGGSSFITAAGGDATDRTVRAQVDFDSAQILRKNRGFADAILNFGRKTGEAVVDAAAETERLRAEQEAVKDVTGGGAVVLKPKRTSKLPGL